jgi:four helix bundle protein
MAIAKFNSEAFHERLITFAQDCQKLTKALSKTQSNFVYGKQLLRSSSSPGANYIEALEAFSKKDFVHKLRICRKETRESIYWLRLIFGSNEHTQEIQDKCKEIIEEGQQIIRFLTSSIVTLELNLKL